MLAFLPQLPSVFVSLSDSLKIFCNVGEEGSSMTMTALDGASYYRGVHWEKDLEKLKAGEDWPTFFRDIETSFVGKTIKAAPGNGTMNVTVKGTNGDVCFSLPKDCGDGPLSMVTQMFQWWSFRNEKDVGHSTLENLSKKEQEARRQVQSLEQERNRLQNVVICCEEEEKSLMDGYAQLQAELGELSEMHRREFEESAVEFDEPLYPDFSKPVGRLPLDLVPANMDTFLLKLIKSKYCPLDALDHVSTERNDAWLSVIQPFSKPEYAAHLAALEVGPQRMVMKVMDKLDRWDYDVWTVQDMTGGGALFHTAYALFCRWDLFRRFQLDEAACINFFQQIEAGYHPNPYHNSQHGADVLHIVHYICGKGGLIETAQLTSEDLLAALIAGMIHDYDHPGLNNNFHVKVQSYLATLYNDRSILENHHCAEVFDMMRNPQYDILGTLSEAQRRDVRETVVDMVMSTDMGLHAKIFGGWKRRLTADSELHRRKEDQRLALTMAIKMADISNCGRPENLYLKWSTKLVEEFFLQGDNERNRGQTVSPFMDRFAPSMAKSQIAFMNFVVIPMFESVAEYLPEMHFTVELCESNKSYWTMNDDSL